MRFCSFCNAETSDERNTCGACGRRLPPLPPRKQLPTSAPGALPLPKPGALPPLGNPVTSDHLSAVAQPEAARARRSTPTLQGGAHGGDESEASAPTAAALAGAGGRAADAIVDDTTVTPNTRPTAPVLQAAVEAAHARRQSTNEISAALAPPIVSSNAPAAVRVSSASLRTDATVPLQGDELHEVAQPPQPPRRGPVAEGVPRDGGVEVVLITGTTAPHGEATQQIDPEWAEEVERSDAAASRTVPSATPPPTPPRTREASFRPQATPMPASTGTLVPASVSPASALGPVPNGGGAIAAPNAGGAMPNLEGAHATPGSAHAEGDRAAVPVPLGDTVTSNSGVAAIAAEARGTPRPGRDISARVAISLRQGGVPTSVFVGTSARIETDLGIEATISARTPTAIEVPPTRVFRIDGIGDRPFVPASVQPVPEVPDKGLVNAARYALTFARARWQRRRAVKVLAQEIKADTAALDEVLGALGVRARQHGVNDRVFSAENDAISAAELRRVALVGQLAELDGKLTDENARFAAVEGERKEKLAAAERAVTRTTTELEDLQAQRRGLRDKRRDTERRHKAYVKAADDRDAQSASQPIGEERARIRQAAEQMRQEAAALEPEQQEIERKLVGLEGPIATAQTRADAARAELDAAKRSLADAREGHTHRLDEIAAEKKRFTRDIASCDAEIGRRLVTLGTLVNLNRVDDAQFHELYERVDRLRGAITARSAETERLAAERAAYHRETLLRGVAVLGGVLVACIALAVVVRALL